MDQKFRDAQKAYHRDNENLEAASKYIRILEQMMGIVPVNKEKVNVNGDSVKCLLCETELKSADRVGPWPVGIDEGWVKITPTYSFAGPNGELIPRTHISNPSDGVSVSTSGNWGSRVLDGSTLYFFICDVCIIKNSHKMWHREIEHFDPKIRDTIENAQDFFKQCLTSVQSRIAENAGTDGCVILEKYEDALVKYFLDIKSSEVK